MVVCCIFRGFGWFITREMKIRCCEWVSELLTVLLQYLVVADKSAIR